MKNNRHGQAAIISEIEYQKIRKSLRSKKYKLLLDIARFTGERWGAIVQLKIEDIFDNAGNPLGEITFPAGILISKVETLLMHSGKFRLPGKKQLDQNAYTWEVLVVDVTESAIERQKKTASLLQWQEKAAYFESASSGQPNHWANSLHCFWKGTSPRLAVI